jgi:protein-L-isoaspartate(D-aspartate) O-methyltransferase
LPDWARVRAEMVEDQLRARGIKDARVLEAMGRVPREQFVPAAQQSQAYEDGPLPIGEGQTISQPWMVARMLELGRFQGTEKVLEVGAGSGYQAALLCELAHRVYAVERLASLAEQARARMAACGYRNFEIGVFDGTGGWPEHAPFDVILVAAGAPSLPPLLVDQLSEGGRLIIPIGPRRGQKLAVVTRNGEAAEVSWDTSCTFVDLVGRYGWGGSGVGQA